MSDYMGADYGADGGFRDAPPSSPLDPMPSPFAAPPAQFGAVVAAAHEHLWDTTGSQSYRVTDTSVLQRCAGCGDVRTVILAGSWALAEVLATEPPETPQAVGDP